MDGTKALHDLYRVDSHGYGTYKTVAQAMAMLQKHHVNINALCVITGTADRKGQAVYQALKKLGFRYLQFIPCLDPLGEE